MENCYDDVYQTDWEELMKTMEKNLVIKTEEIITLEEIARVFEEDPEIEFVTINPD